MAVSLLKNVRTHGSPYYCWATTMRDCSKTLFLILFCLPLVSQADYGEAFLSINCDKSSGTFEVEPLIIWNEELDAIKAKIKNGKGKVRDHNKIFLHTSATPLQAHCNMSGVSLTARISDGSDRDLEILSNDKQVMKITIGDVWDFWGYVFRVRYTSTRGWEEFCGREEAEKSWAPLNEKRTDTNCRTQR